MRVVDVKYDEYAVIHTIKTKDDSITILNKLYGKNLKSLKKNVYDSIRLYM